MFNLRKKPREKSLNFDYMSPKSGFVPQNDPENISAEPNPQMLKFIEQESKKRVKSMKNPTPLDRDYMEATIQAVIQKSLLNIEAAKRKNFLTLYEINSTLQQELFFHTHIMDLTRKKLESLNNERNERGGE